MTNAIHWFGNLSLTRGCDDVPTLESFELDGRYLYHEKRILVDALEAWLENWNREFGYHDRQASKRRMI
jgi:hypothetical protein